MTVWRSRAKIWFASFIMSKFEKKSGTSELLVVFISNLSQLLESVCFVPDLIINWPNDISNLGEFIVSNYSFSVTNYSNGRVESRRRYGKSFIPSSSHRFEGIIAHLTKRCGGNVRDHNIGTMLTTAWWQSRWAKHAANLMNNTQFCTMNAPNQWICCDFKTMLTESLDYSTPSYSAVLGHVNQKNWWLSDQRVENHGWNLTVVTGTRIWMAQCVGNIFDFAVWVCSNESASTRRSNAHGWQLSEHDYIGNFRFSDRMINLMPEQRLDIHLSMPVRIYTVKSNEANWRIRWHMRGARIMTRSRHKSHQIIHTLRIISHLLGFEARSFDSDALFTKPRGIPWIAVIQSRLCKK
jgi:hypothetical protein